MRGAAPGRRGRAGVARSCLAARGEHVWGKESILAALTPWPAPSCSGAARDELEVGRQVALSTTTPAPCG